ncbi:MAG TPA: cytochrome o ubiquinol oxidase subunit IV [Rhodopila sp.]|uniref:cytochrome o ubiquinol oxidase subunit IV n=1 Tax=Rhodopila sp. TaxID=2480087 RepID=UPI002C6463B5|nr:cytochrome o ubiquinol oxidase subunit IV [Rhodopila sp.]HVY13985.1 cytochrome o ubiquinol oxidase subunit IV [Rhodopila sp.]
MTGHAAQTGVHAGLHPDGHDHGSHRTYLTGFALSVILTAIPFWLVMTGVLANNQVTGLLIMALAAVQIVVHMIYFLHMSSRSEGGWSMMALVFTLVLVLIALAGSMWVMYHLNANMMPGMTDMSRMP